MITLITGCPAVGKTLYAAYLLTTREQLQNRPLFADGVCCSFPFPAYSPFRFLQPLPDNAVLFIDDAQRILGNKQSSAADITAWHDKGVDILLTAQHPFLICKDVRSLIGEHIHLVRLKRQTETFTCLYRWPYCSQVDEVLDMQSLLTTFVNQSANA